MQRLPIPTRSGIAGAREPQAVLLAPVHPALAAGALSEKGSVGLAPHRPAFRPGNPDAPRSAATDWRATPEARGYGAG